MLEGLVAGILSSYLGVWVEGLQRENLKIGIKQGNVTIENLKLRKEALRDLHLPIAIKDGYLAKLQLIIPWSNLSSKPAIIRIEQVFLTAGPMHQDHYDQQEEERKEQETKQKRLALRELFNVKDKKDESDTFTARLVAKVVANLQLFIEKIHIRYEDDTQNPEAPFALGITLERLSAETTDASWRPTFMKENQPLVHKLVSLSNFAIYWDSNTFMFDQHKEQTMHKALEEMIHDESKKGVPRHAYFLRPISGTLKLIMNKSTAIKDIPKFTLNFFFEKIALELQENQYREMLGFLESFGLYQRSLQHRAYRPSELPTKDPRAWWSFAANASLASKREERRKWNFEVMKEANSDRKRYVRLYKRHLELEQKKQHLTPTDAAALVTLEKRLDYDRIVLFRSLAEAYLEKEKQFKEREKQKRIESEKATGAASSEYGNGIWKWWTGAAADTTPTPDLELTDAVWKELFAAVNDEYVTVDRVDVSLHIAEGSFQLKNAAPAEPTAENLAIILFVFNGLFVNLNTTTHYSPIKIDGRLNTMQAFDFNTPNTKYPLLLTPAPASEPDALEASGEVDPCFFRFSFASFLPKEADVDYKLRVDMQPLKVVFNENIVARISSFFRSSKQNAPTQVVAHDVEDRVSSRLGQFSDQSHQQLAWLLEYKKVFDMHINIKAPTIVVPLSFEEESSALLLDFGHLSLRSDLSADQRRKERERERSQLQEREKVGNGSSRAATSTAIEDDFYSKFNLRVTSIQAFVVAPAVGVSALEPGDRTLEAARRQQIIEKFDLHFIICLNKLKATPLTSTKIEGELPSLAFCLSAWSCNNLMQILAARLMPALGSSDGEAPSGQTAPEVAAPAATTTDQLAAKAASQEETRSLLAGPMTTSATLRDKKRLQLDFAVKSLSISVYREEECVDLRSCSPMVFFRAQGMSVRLVRRLLNMQVDGTLQTILLRDYHQPWGNAFRDLLVPQSLTPGTPLSSLAQPLFEFHLFKRLGNDQSALASVHPSDDKQLDAGASGLLEVQLRDLRLMVNQETLVVLVKFVNTNLLRPLKRVRPTTPASALSVSPRPSPHSNSTTSSPSKAPKAGQASPSPASLRIAANLGCVKFILNHGGKHLAEAYLDRSRFEVLPGPQGTRVEGNVGHLKLLDLASSFAPELASQDLESPTPPLDPAIARVFQEIVMVQGGTDALTFTLTLARRTAVATAPPAEEEGSSLVISATGVKVLLVHQFFSRLLGYAAELRSLISPSTSSSASSPSAPASSSADTAPDVPFRLAVNIKNGRLLLPEKWSSSMSVALATIRSFAITNDGTDLQRRFTFAVRGMDLDWGAVAVLERADGDGAKDGSTSGHFAKKHALAKGLALDIGVGLPRAEEDALRAGLPLQDILVKAPAIDVGFTSRQAVHVFGILEELLDGLFRKRGVLEHIDVLLDSGPKPPRLELHRKRRVLVAIDKLVLRLLPSGLEKDTVPSFLLDASNLKVDCNWTSDERMAVDAGTSAASLMQYSPLTKQNFKALVLESTEEDRSFWLTYDKKPSGSRVAQSIGVGLGKATALAVPEGIRRLCDAIPVIWGALTRATDKTGRGPPAEAFVFTFSIAAPSFLALCPSDSLSAGTEEATATTIKDKALRGCEVRTYGSFSFTLRKRMDETEAVIDEQLRVDCPSIVDLRLAGSKDPFVACRGLLWTYSPALFLSAAAAVPSAELLTSSPSDRRMSVEALSFELLLSATELSGLTALWQRWRTVVIARDEGADKTGEEKLDKKDQTEPSLIVRTQFRQARIGLIGRRSEHEQEELKVLDAHLNRLAFVIDHESSASSLSIAGSAAEASLQDPLAPDYARIVASTKFADTDTIAFSYSSLPVRSDCEPHTLVKVALDGLWVLFAPAFFSRFFYFIGSLRSPPEPQDKSRPPPVPMKLDVTLRQPLLQIPHSPEEQSPQVALITGESFSISNQAYFDQKQDPERGMLEQFWFKLRNGTLRLGTLPLYVAGDALDRWKAVTRAVDIDLMFERPLHDPLGTYPVHNVLLSFPSPMQFTSGERDAAGVLRAVEAVLAGLFHFSTNPIMPSIDRAFPSAPPLSLPSSLAPAPGRLELKRYRIDVPSLAVLLHLAGEKQGSFSFLFEHLHVDVWKSEPAAMTCLVRTSSVSVSDASAPSTPMQLLAITNPSAEVLVAEGREPESALRLNYESVGGAEGHMTQKIDLSVGRAEVLVLELPALFSALGQLHQALNAALAKMGPPVAVVTVVDTVTYKLGLKQCSVLAPHPFLNPLAPDRSGNGKGAGGTDASPTGPSVFYVCRMSDMQVDVLKELLPFSSPMTGSSSSLSSSTSSASSSHVYEIGAVMEDFEFCKCQASSAVVHLGSFIAGAAESAVPILDPLSGSLRVSTRDELDITFDTGLIGIHLALQDVSPLQALQQRLLGIFSGPNAADSSSQQQPRPAGAGEGAEQTTDDEGEDGDWTCAGCSLLNPPHSSACVLCGTARVGEDLHPSTQPPAAEEPLYDDWTMITHSDHRQRSGSGGGGNVEEQRWMCEGCSMLNTSSAQTCAMCERRKDGTVTPSASSAVVAQSSAKPPKKKQSVRVSPLNVMLDVVDEDLGIPLYQLTATANLVDIDNRNHHLGHMKAAVSLSEVTIHYFNWYKEINETLLEPWNLQVKIMRHPRLPTKIVLQSSGKMELNLTRPFLEMTSRVLSEKKWITDDSSSLPSSSLSSSSENRVAIVPSVVRPQHSVSRGQTLAIIRNETGVEMLFFIHDPARSGTGGQQSAIVDSSAAAQREWIRVASGEERGVKLPSVRRVRGSARGRSAAGFSTATLSVKLDGPFKLLHSLPLHPPGKSTLNIAPEGRKPLSVLYHIGHRRGSKFICIRSPLQINNYTKFAMRVLVQLPPPLHALEMTCPERSNVPIPLSIAASEGVIRVAPVAPERQLGWLYSDQGLHFKGTHTKPDTKFLTCRWADLPNSSRPVVAPPFVLRVAVKEASGSRRLLILPPLKLHNLLHCDMHYRAFDAETKKCFSAMMSGTLAPGQETDLHIFDVTTMKTRLALTIQISNFQWSTGVLVHGRQNAKFISVLDDQQQPIQLRMVQKKDTGEVCHVRIFADYWLINKTGIRLHYLQGDQHERTRIPGQPKVPPAHAARRLEGDPRNWYKEGAQWAAPQPETLVLSMADGGGNYSSSSQQPPQQQVFVRLATSRLSPALNLAAGASGVLALEDPATPAVFQIAVAAHEAPGPFWRTRVVTFAPYRVLVNRLKVPVEYRQAGTQEVFRLLPDEALPWHWPARDLRPRHLCVRLLDPPSKWSGPFLVNVPQPVTFTIRRQQQQQKQESSKHPVHPLVRVEIRLAETTQYIVLRPENMTHPLYRIENLSSYSILLRQKPREQQPSGPTTTMVEEVLPHCTTAFGWDDPTHEWTVHMKILSRSPDARHVVLSVPLNEFKRYPPIQTFQPVVLLVEVLPSGPTTILRITEGALRRRGATMEMVRKEPEGAQEPVERLSWEAQVMVDSIVLSLIDDASGPLVRAAITTPYLYLSSSDLYHKAELTVRDLRLLNLLPSTPFPTLLAPLRPPSSSSSSSSSRRALSQRSMTEVNNFVHVTAVKARGAGDIGADYFKYVGVAVQPFDINAEGAILMKLMDFKDRVLQGLLRATSSPDSPDTNAAAALALLFPSAPSSSSSTTISSSCLFEPPAITENKALCLGQLDLHPVACRLSFKYVSGFDYSSLHSILSWTGGLANIDAAPLRFNALFVRNTLSTREEFVERVKRHYAGEVQQQIGKLLGHLSVLGAPLSFVTGLGSSTSDLFRESARSVVRSPHEFGRGASPAAAAATGSGSSAAEPRPARASMSMAPPASMTTLASSSSSTSRSTSSSSSLGGRAGGLRQSFSSERSSSASSGLLSPRSSLDAPRPHPQRQQQGEGGSVDSLLQFAARPLAGVHGLVAHSAGALASTVTSMLPTRESHLASGRQRTPGHGQLPNSGAARPSS